jgi:hypothetical protein
MSLPIQITIPTSTLMPDGTYNLENLTFEDLSQVPPSLLAEQSHDWVDKSDNPDLYHYYVCSNQQCRLAISVG